MEERKSFKIFMLNFSMPKTIDEVTYGGKVMKRQFIYLRKSLIGPMTLKAYGTLEWKLVILSHHNRDQIYMRLEKVTRFTGFCYG